MQNKTLRCALVVGNGDLPSFEIIRREIVSADFVLAADGGANKLFAIGMTPDAVIGDFDSLIATLPNSVARISAPDQNFTDLEKAIRYLHSEGCDQITITGVTGDRLDHTFGALAVVVKHKVRLVDDIGTATAVIGPGHTRLETKPGVTVSLMPVGKVSGLTTLNLKWDLHYEDFDFANRDGTSNVARESFVEVSVASGDLIVYVHHSS